MKKLICIIILLLVCGCMRGDIQAETAIKDRPVSFDGITLSPEQWTETGEPAKFTGVHINFKGLSDIVNPVE